MRPQLRSKISNIQLLLLVKYESVSEFGIEVVMKPILKDINRLESVSTDMYTCTCTCICTFSLVNIFFRMKVSLL